MPKHANRVNTFWVKIYLAGPIEVAKQIIRLRAADEGMCVTIEPTTFIYTGGEEEGYVVGFVNYPRFPEDSASIWRKALNLANDLRTGTGQHSCMVMSPDHTFWYTSKFSSLESSEDPECRLK